MNTKLVSFYILFGGAIFNAMLYVFFDYGLREVKHHTSGNTLFLFYVRSSSYVFVQTLGLFLISLFVLWIIKLFKKRWSSFVIPSIVITVLIAFVTFRGHMDYIREYNKSSNYPSSNLNVKPQRKTESKDIRLAIALIGTWKEDLTKGCGNYHIQTTYNSDNTFVDFTKLIAINDCWVNTIRLDRGDSLSLTTTGRWWVDNSYLHHYVEDSSNVLHTDIGEKYIQRIIAIDKNNYRFERDDFSISNAKRIE
jgi:hypothetical protein